MPATLSYPGVYIEEIPSGVRTITGVATSITAFIGRTRRGPVNQPTVVNSFADFERLFGGLAADHTVAYAVKDFFGNGGGQAIIVRLYKPFFATTSMQVAAAGMALTDAQKGADAVNLAAQNEKINNVTPPTAASVKTAANNAIPLSPSAKPAERLAAEKVAAAAAAEADRAPYTNNDSLKMDISGNPTGGKIKFAAGSMDSGDILITDLTDSTSAGSTSAATAVKNAFNALFPGTVMTVVRTGPTPAASTNFSFLITFQTASDVPQPASINVTSPAGSPLTPAVSKVTISFPQPDADSVAKAASDAAGTMNNPGPAVTSAVGQIAPNNRARLTIPNGANDLTLEAATPGAWGNLLQVEVDYATKPDDNGMPDTTLYNLTITDGGTGKTEQIRNVTGTANAVRSVSRVLDNESSLVRVVGTAPTARPAETMGTPITVGAADVAVDSQPLSAVEFEGSAADKTGLFALDKADLFNVLCIPADTRDGDTPVTTYPAAANYCSARRAMLVVDPPAAWTANPDTAAAKALAGLNSVGIHGPAARNAALFFPRIIESDPTRGGQLDVFVPCGAIAGIFARTDSTRGVWKAPAGLDAAINGIAGLQVNLSDGENGQLNPQAVNSLRNFAVAGPVVWGARTLRGADAIGDEYKYIPVRRTALFIEESLYRGTQWVVFEPNDEPLWAQIRLNVGAFMHNLFRQGAFQGVTPKEAYFVKCDKETTTQNDIDLGVVNILVGFAPLKPAEFVVIKLQQIAGQIQT
ncbi:MAG TPA: phage tail sheath C-terminal domain-containing protein [Chthoniobacterales bacterium]|nr:phage tail sheath C-terminal domain-containing protein [Chthoniobacterales bacterium]